MRKANPKNKTKPNRRIPSKSKAPPNKIRNLNHFKPKKFNHYLTLAELCMWLEKHGQRRHYTRILKLEREGKIPEASRAQCGQIAIRLWSPEQAREILRLLRTEIKPGRPPNAT